jgi:hypothetical protein
MSLQSFTPTSTLDAVNALLAAAGEAPVASLEDAAGRPDVDLAHNTVAETHADLTARRWLFNTEYNVPVATSMGLPADVLSFEATPRVDQRYLDVGVRGSTFYDRTTGGLPALLHLNVVRFVPFAQLPETARRYILAAAATRYVQRSQGATEALQLLAAAEQGALAALAAEQVEQPPVPHGTAATLLDAVNAVLVAAGQAPARTLYAFTGVRAGAHDAVLASLYELLAERWTFNTDPEGNALEVAYTDLPVLARAAVVARATMRYAPTVGAKADAAEQEYALTWPKLVREFRYRPIRNITLTPAYRLQFRRYRRGI